MSTADIITYAFPDNKDYKSQNPIHSDKMHFLNIFVHSLWRVAGDIASLKISSDILFGLMLKIFDIIANKNVWTNRINVIVDTRDFFVEFF